MGRPRDIGDWRDARAFTISTWAIASQEGTTETTTGAVETVSATSQVDYGTGNGIATFSDQFVIRADSGDFSQGGDSGSAIVDEDGFVGGLLSPAATG